MTLLPPDAPLAMPVQSFWTWEGGARAVPSAPGLSARRILVLGGALVLTALAIHEMYRVLAVAGLTGLEGALLVLFALLVPWLALSFASALAGAWARLRLKNRPGDLDFGAGEGTSLPRLAELAALLVPIHNEAPGRIAANIEAIAASLARAGRLEKFHVFVLSDSTDADAWVAEEAAMLALRDRLPREATLFYRRRPKNIDRKAGNIADWVRRFGAPYAQFVVLDADSLMDGETLVRLAAAMERNPHVGLIQTIPVVVGAATLFARIQQFAARLYGPVIGSGLGWWHGPDGNYWGHNAILRTRAFAEAAGLPHLRGRKPFGGHIMSHDFVEAALMRRAGWAVQMAPALPGSFEESPPSLVDLATRDRRWCQGNLQHVKLLPARGLHWASRLHFLTGIAAYAAAPLWLAFLVVGIVASLQARFIRPDYFPAGFTLFPQWPVQDPERAMRLFVLTMAVLIAPKLLAYGVMLADRAARRAFGGGARAFAGVVLEAIVSGLIAPVMMLVQSSAVAAVMAGRDAGWKTQRREGMIPFREIVRRHLWHSLFGVALGVASWLVSPSLFWWMSPVALGLVLAIPISALTALSGAGRAAGKLGLFRTPEEAAPPDVLVEARTALSGLPASGPIEAFARLAADPRLLAAHRADLPLARQRGDPIDADLLVARLKLEEAEDLEAALARLTPREKLAALSDAAALDRAIALASAAPARASVTAAPTNATGEADAPRAPTAVDRPPILSAAE